MSGMVQAGHDSHAGLENGTGSKRPVDGFIQICADAVFHRDVLKMVLSKGVASDAPSDGRITQQAPTGL